MKMWRCKRVYLLFGAVFVFLSWNILTYYTLNTSNTSKDNEADTVEMRVNELQKKISAQIQENEQLLNLLKILKQNADLKESSTRRDKVPVLPVLMIACDRTSVSRSLDILLKYRPSSERFPLIISQDCGHEPTAAVIQSYVIGRNISHITHIKHPDLSEINLPWPQKKFAGYYKIARHYKWALNQIFHNFNYSAVIIVEDDLDVAPDFFEYFEATYSLLQSDPSLWCVSAWNDNGKFSMISDEPEKLYRTDFFPGLGWMIERNIWLELEDKWPDTFWDDWMRHPEQRKNRHCIRPEICRTSTFGKKGVSKGLYFDKHLQFIHLNNKFVPFTQKNLSYLHKDHYDAEFTKTVYQSALLTASDVVNGIRPEERVVRVQYDSKDDFKNAAKLLGIMDDFKAGVARAAYRGVVTFMLNGRRVYLAPPPDWAGYDITWN